MQVLDTEAYRLEEAAAPDEIASLRKELEAKANHKDAEAIVRLASLHLHGIGVKKDGDKWEQLVRQAADLGHPRSQYDVAMFILRDKDPRKDDGKKFAPGTRPAEHTGMPKDAEEWLKKAIAGSDTWAMTFLAGHYMEKKRFADAMPLLQRAAELEAEGCAKYLLASAYLEGRAVPKDLAKVEDLFLASRGCSNVGIDAFELYTEGKRAPKDYGKALRILAQDESFGPNKIRMGRLYETGGPGVPQDRKKALALYKAAGALGFEVGEDLKRLGHTK